MDERRLPARHLAAIVIAAAVLFGGVVLWAAASANLATEGRELLELTWGRVLLLDFYLGVALFAGWILWREPLRRVALAWVAALALLRNVVACAYVLRALVHSGGRAAPFWNGPGAS